MVLIFMSTVLIKIYRGKLVENIYRGDIAIVDQNKNILYSAGSNKKVTYWRSAAKPIQALPIIYSGASNKYNLTEQEIAVMASSHNGEEKHIKLIYSILKKINLEENSLQCGICSPLHKPTAANLLEKGIQLNPIFNPCSGKHASQLALCRYYNWSIEDYYRNEHPVQKMILKVISDLTSCNKENIYLGIDGCGVPVFGLPIKNMSIAYALIANWESLPSEYRTAGKVLYSSMTNYPEIVGGTKRFDTNLIMSSKSNILAKSGADGVFCLGIRKDKKIKFSKI